MHDDLIAAMRVAGNNRTYVAESERLLLTKGAAALEAMQAALDVAKEALENLAAQSSGEVCSTKLSDCMAAVASHALEHTDAAMKAGEGSNR